MIDQESDQSSRELHENVPRSEQDVFSSLKKDRNYILLGLRIAGDFGVTLALPVVLFVIIGQWLDGKLDKSPIFTILAFLLAAVVSAIMIYKKAQKYSDQYNNLNKKIK